MITKLHELPPDHHLRNTAIQHIDDNRHLADGDNCTLIDLKKALG